MISFSSEIVVLKVGMLYKAYNQRNSILKCSKHFLKIITCVLSIETFPTHLKYIYLVEKIRNCHRKTHYY